MKHPARASIGPAWGVLLLLALMGHAARAADLTLEAKLIRAANESPDTVKYKLADAAMAAGLRHSLKWTNYYEITNVTAVIPLRQSRNLKMSDRCALRIKNLGDSRIEVNCIRQGRQVSTGTYTLPPKWLILGGNETNGTAWFVGLRAAPAGTVWRQSGRK